VLPTILVTGSVPELTKRSQQIVLDGAQSDPEFVQSGVPQGTFLGPLIY